MTTLSSAIGKPVLNLATSCIIGNVTDVYFDEYLKKAVYFCIVDKHETLNFTPPLTEQNTANPLVADNVHKATKPLKLNNAQDTSKFSDVDNTQNTLKLLAVADAQNVADAIVIPDDMKILSAKDMDLTLLRSSVLGLAVYTPAGLSKGNVLDIAFNNAGKVTKLQTQSDEFAPSAILSIGEIILQKPNAKNKSRKTTIPRPKTDYPVYILNDTAQALAVEKSILNSTGTTQINDAQTIKNDAKFDEKTAKNSEKTTQNGIKNSEKIAENDAKNTQNLPDFTQKTPQISHVKSAISLGDSREPVLSNGAFEVLLDGSQAYSYDEDAHTPTRVICDYEFLLGRTLGADLCTYTGDLIAKQGSAVTDFVVEKARRAGKLVELTLNSIKPEKQNRI